MLLSDLYYPKVAGMQISKSRCPELLSRIAGDSEAWEAQVLCLVDVCPEGLQGQCEQLVTMGVLEVVSDAAASSLSHLGMES